MEKGSLAEMHETLVRQCFVFLVKILIDIHEFV